MPTADQRAAPVTLVRIAVDLAPVMLTDGGRAIRVLTWPCCVISARCVVLVSIPAPYQQAWRRTCVDIDRL
ncbi:hypothetical protein GCM10018966_025900 [Streptomyces yanii]